MDGSQPAAPLHRRRSAVALVGLGGIFGAPARAAIAAAWPNAPSAFPTATFVTNLSGAFVLGFLLESLARRGPARGLRGRPGPNRDRRWTVRLLVGTGFCGAYTTYSTFALDADELVRAGRSGLAVLYAGATVVAGLICTVGGLAAAAGHHRVVAALLPMDPDLDRSERDGEDR